MPFIAQEEMNPLEARGFRPATAVVVSFRLLRGGSPALPGNPVALIRKGGEATFMQGNVIMLNPIFDLKTLWKLFGSTGILHKPIMKASLRTASGSAGHQPRNSGSVVARVKSGAGAPRSQREDRKQVLRLSADSDYFPPVIPAQAGIRFQVSEDRGQRTVHLPGASRPQILLSSVLCLLKPETWNLSSEPS